MYPTEEDYYPDKVSMYLSVFEIDSKERFTIPFPSSLPKEMSFKQFKQLEASNDPIDVKYRLCMNATRYTPTKHAKYNYTLILEMDYEDEIVTQTIGSFYSNKNIIFQHN